MAGGGSLEVHVSTLRLAYAHAVRRMTKLLPKVVLACLILANVALILLLFRPDRALQAQPAETASSAISSASVSDTPTPSASISQSSSPESSASRESIPSTPSVEPSPPQRLLYAVSEKTAWRATVGDCDTPGMLERSTNRGTSWKRVVRTGLGPIVRLGQTGSDLYIIGGVGRHCSSRYVAYAADGKVTAATNSPVDIWFPTPADRDEVNGPSDTKARPCNDHIIGLTSLSLSRALVVCANGSAMNTVNSGKTWRKVARVPRTLAVASGNGRYWLAGVTTKCEGITVRSLNVKGSEASEGVNRCVPAKELTSGQVALDVSGNSIWVWTGSRVQVSTDSGRSWT
jgi:hypothetical protein